MKWSVQTEENTRKRKKRRIRIMDNPKRDSTSPSVPTTPTLSPEDQAYMEFIKRNHTRCVAWAKSHGDINFPIVRTPNGFQWLNRAQRRNSRQK